MECVLMFSAALYMYTTIYVLEMRRLYIQRTRARENTAMHKSYDNTSNGARVT